MKTSAIRKLLGSLAFLACTSLSAAPLVVDLNNVQSVGEFGDPDNTRLTFNVGANSTITSVNFDVTLEAFGGSWLSEMSIIFGNSDLDFNSVFLDNIGGNASGTTRFTEFFDLQDLDLSFNVGADGILLLEFFESFNDFPGADGQWNGTITFGVEPVDVEEPGEVPEPSTTLLMGAGLAMLGYAGRRRRAAGKTAA